MASARAPCKTLTEVITAIEKSVTEPRRHDLPVLRAQSVRRLLHLHQHGHGDGAQPVRRACSPPISAPLPLLLGFIVVVAIIDLLLTGAIAKWAIFAPVFVPLLMKLGVEPEAVLAAYRVGDSPMNAITPLNAYFALVVGFAQKYDKVRRRRHDRVADAAVCGLDVRALDGALRALANARTALGSVNAARAARNEADVERSDGCHGDDDQHSIPLDVAAAEAHLMRFLSVEGVTGQEANIAAAVSDALKEVGVPASAIRFDDANKRIPVPTETGNLIVDLPGHAAGTAAVVLDPSRHGAALRRRQAAARGRPDRLGRHDGARRRQPHRRARCSSRSPRR